MSWDALGAIAGIAGALLAAVTVFLMIVQHRERLAVATTPSNSEVANITAKPDALWIDRIISLALSERAKIDREMGKKTAVVGFQTVGVSVLIFLCGYVLMGFGIRSPAVFLGGLLLIPGTFVYLLFRRGSPTSILNEYPTRLYKALQALLADPAFTPAAAKETREQILLKAPKLIILYDDAVAAKFASRATVSAA